MAVSISMSITQNSQSVTDNTSNVTVKVTAKWTYGSYNATGQCTGSITIDGTKYSFSGITFNTGQSTSGSQTIMKKTVNIAHSDDGTKTLSCSASFVTGVSSGTVKTSKSTTLTTIPRKSTLTASNGTLGTAQTLTVTRKSTSFTHTITYSCGSESGTIASKSSSTSISWTPPLSLASQNTTGTSVSVTLTITTYSGSTSIGSNTATITCSIPSSVKPSCKITVSEATSHGAYVKGLSKLKIVVTPTLSYGSAIASYSVSANGSSYTTATVTTGVLNSAGTMTITATVKDGRGRSGSASTTITVVDKSTLSVGNGTLGTAQTVSLTKGHSSFRHQIVYTCGTKSGYILGGANVSSTDSSVSWTPPLSLATENTTGTSVSVTVTLYTYTSGGSSVGSTSATKTFSIPASVKPTVSLAVSDDMGYANTYGAYVQGKSKLNIVATASGSQGSTIETCKTMTDGKTYTDASFTTDVISGTGTLSITATVTDSRGRTATASTSISVLAYSSPKINSLTVSRCDSSGNASSSGAYLAVRFGATISPLNNKNKAEYILRYQKTTESGYAPRTLTDYAGKYSVSNGIYIFAADTSSSYKITLLATDDFSTASMVGNGSSIVKTWSMFKNGLGFAFGKVASLANCLDMGWNIELNSNEVLRNGAVAYAPVGYGLGKRSEQEPHVMDCDTVFVNGWYLIDKEAKSNPFPGTHCAMRVDNHTVSNTVQNAYCGTYTSLGMVYKQRSYRDDVWGEWEWVNPPMAIGTEYRTTERFVGRPVYKKLVSLGGVSSGGTMTVSHGITDANYILDCKLFDSKELLSLVGTTVQCTKTQIKLTLPSGSGGANVYAIISYDKVV